MGKINFRLILGLYAILYKALGHVLIIRDVLTDGFGVWLSNCDEI